MNKKKNKQFMILSTIGILRVVDVHMGSTGLLLYIGYPFFV